MAKIRIREIEAHLAGIQKIIDDCRTNIAAENAAGGEDSPPDFPGKPANPTMDSAVNLRGRGSKGLTAIVGPSSGLLESIVGYGRIHQHHSDAFKSKKSVE